MAYGLNTMTYGFKTIEKKYGVKVLSEGHTFFPYSDRCVETFAMYDSEGCCWAKGLSRKGVKAECERWAKELLTIKNHKRG